MFEKCSYAPKRIFFRAALPNFFEIHKVFLQKFAFAARKNLSLLSTQAIFQTSPENHK